MGATGTKPAKRTDLKQRHLEGYGPWRVTNKDPEMHYVLVDKTNRDLGVSYYESLGYEIVRATREGPSLSGGKTTRKESDVIEHRDLVLMQISKEDLAELEKYGPDGNSGQAFADLLEKQILDKRGGMDPLRGLSGVMGKHGPYLRVQKMVEAMQAEAPVLGAD